jgi:serine/threonine-protein kinase HipA
MVFNVLARNCDDHTKNFAFMMDRQGQWSLTPAYDVCHAYRPESTWVSRHALSINGKREHIKRQDLLAVASQMNIRKAGQIISDIQTVVDEWEQYAGKTKVAKNLTQAIRQSFIKI